MNNNKMKPNLIIRTGIGSKRPLFPQVQHVGDFTNAISKMSTKIEIIKLRSPDEIFKNYKDEHGQVIEGIVIRTHFSNNLSVKYINGEYDSKT